MYAATILTVFCKKKKSSTERSKEEIIHIRKNLISNNRQYAIRFEYEQGIYRCNISTYLLLIFFKWKIEKIKDLNLHDSVGYDISGDVLDFVGGFAASEYVRA